MMEEENMQKETEKQREKRYKEYQRYVNKQAREAFKRPAFARTNIERGGKK